MSKPNDRMTPKEVARMFDVTTRTVRAWTASGRIIPYRMSARTVRYSRAQVLAAMDERMPGVMERPHDPAMG